MIGRIITGHISKINHEYQFQINQYKNNPIVKSSIRPFINGLNAL